MLYGYVRVSSADQNPERQIEAMEKAGVDRVIVDKASGASFERDGYLELMSLIGEGDRVLLDSLDRLGRNYDKIVSEWKRITREVGCDLAALDLEFMDSRKFREFGDMGRMIEDMLLSALAWAAQQERENSKRRQRGGIEVAKAAGKYKGRKPKEVDMERYAVLRTAQKRGEVTVEKAASELGISRSKWYDLAKR